MNVLTENRTSASEFNSDGEAPNNAAKVVSEQPEGKKAFNSSFGSLKNKIINSEKTRMEKEFKAERKKLLKENEQLLRNINDKEDLWMVEKNKLETSLKLLKKQIRDQQNERDKEQQNHAVMIKELQMLVADERLLKEKLEQQIENLKFALEKMPDKRLEYETQIAELRNELKDTKHLLEAAEGEKKDLPSLLMHLQQEMSEMKASHHEAVDREIKRANEAEEKLKALAKVSEERAANLEQRLSELSQMVGSCDKLRQQDQLAIQKLKERVTQLDQENTALARTVSTSRGEKGLEIDEANLDVQTILEKIAKLKGYLRLSAKKSKKAIHIAGLLNDVQQDSENNVHEPCQRELKQLREQLEKVKKQEQFKVEKVVKTDAETESLKEQVKKLKEELHICKLQQQMAEEQHQKNEHNFQSFIKEMTTRQESELGLQQHDFQVKLFQLEQQLQKQRERSMVLLEDKEKEIISLKSKISDPVKSKEMDKYEETELDTAEYSEMPFSYADDEQLSELISTSVISSKKGRQILHYAQEISRRDVEISNLRRSRLNAETALRELQQMTSLRDEKATNDIEALKSKIQRLEKAEKGVNMEYLKNVVLQFIKCSKGKSQSHMLNAIAAVLHFTTLELEDARTSLNL